MLLILLCNCSLISAEDSIYSGPQANELLPPLKVKGMIGEHSGKEFDFMELADKQPVFLIFVHARTRPAFGLTNALMKYAASRKKDGLASAVVFLTSDATETAKWMNTVQKHFAKEVEWTLSPDGLEGPGAYGLNRNVTLTVLIGKDGKVTENFALIQPSLPADSPKIFKALVAAIGSGEVPDLNELAGARYQEQPDRGMTSTDDPKLVEMLRAVINKQATPEAVDVAASKLEDYLENNRLAQQHLGRVTNTVVNSDRLETYGTPPAREYLKKWAKEYPAPQVEKRD
ncbi:MAG: hypothetical protein CMN21_16430 [Rubinisphaera sp.]|nr:hypothetical protein [Rubinisphaera sp.]